jgi:uncharacterized membrane protein YfcA
MVHVSPLVIPLAFLCELVDSSLGMGFGTILSPILLLMGFEALDVVPAILFSECITGMGGALAHHRLRNVDFHFRTRDTRVALLLASCAVAGTLAATLLAVRLPRPVLQIWIGALVLVMGLLILGAVQRTFRFTWRRIVLLGTVASFNKGLSGGGYGPLVMGGQLLSGVGVRHAVGITSLSEGITCLVGFILYGFLKAGVNWQMNLCVTAGAVLSVPLAAWLLKWIPEKTGRLVVGVVIVALGCLTLTRVVSQL